MTKDEKLSALKTNFTECRDKAMKGLSDIVTGYVAIPEDKMWTFCETLCHRQRLGFSSLDILNAITLPEGVSFGDNSGSKMSNLLSRMSSFLYELPKGTPVTPILNVNGHNYPLCQVSILTQHGMSYAIRPDGSKGNSLGEMCLLPARSDIFEAFLSGLNTEASLRVYSQFIPIDDSQLNAWF